jgi:hypothetical protein
MNGTTIILTELEASALLTPTPSSSPNDTFAITVHDNMFNRAIHYTLNGEEPTLSSEVYTTPVLIPFSTSPTIFKIMFYSHVTKECHRYDGEYSFEYQFNPVPLGIIESILNPIDITLAHEYLESFYYTINTQPISHTTPSTESILNPLSSLRIDDIESLYNIDNFGYISNRIIVPIESTLNIISVNHTDGLESIYATTSITTITNTALCDVESLYKVISSNITNNMESNFYQSTFSGISLNNTGILESVINPLNISHVSDHIESLYATYTLGHITDIYECSIESILNPIEHVTEQEIESILTPFFIPIPPYTILVTELDELLFLTEDGTTFIITETS